MCVTSSRPQIHVLKADPDAYEAVRLGWKKAEIRFDDRGFEVGDFIELRETLHSGAEMARGAELRFTDRAMRVLITHIQTGYGLKDGWVILSIAEA